MEGLNMTADFTGTLQDQLDAINLAINNCLKMQSTQVGQRSTRLAELDKLMALRIHILTMIACSNGSYNSSVGQIDNPDVGGIQPNP